MPLQASVRPENKFSQQPPFRAAAAARAIPQPPFTPFPNRLDFIAIERRLVRVGILLALVLFLVAAAFAQSQPPSERAAGAPSFPAKAGPRTALYGPPTSGQTSSRIGHP